MANRAKQRRRYHNKAIYSSSSSDNDINVNAPELDGKYKIIQKIDHGGYAIVYKAIDLEKTSKHHTEYVAIKRVKTCNLKTSKHVGNSLCIELEILHKFRWHEHFPTINEVLLDKASGTYSIIMEYFEHQPFNEYNQTMNAQQIIKYIHVLLTCINKLSNHGIVHRDIKPQNFLFNPQQNKYMLIDFGLCQIESSIKSEHQKRLALVDQTKKAKNKYFALRSSKNLIKDNAPRDGTPQFRAPEIVLGSTDQDSRIDIFNAGLILALLMLKSNVLFTPTSDYQAIAQFITVFGLNAMRETAHELGRNLELRGLHKREKIHFNNGKDSLLSRSYVTGYENCAQNERSGLAKWVKLRLEYLEKEQGEQWEWSEDLYDLLNGLTACNMYKRLTPKTALQHKIFSKLNC